MLYNARALGDRLVVILANDAHNRKPNAVPAAVRKERLEALGIADRVVVGQADSFAESLRRERPDVLALGYDQRLPDEATAQAVEELHIDVVTLPWEPGKEDDASCR